MPWSCRPESLDFLDRAPASFLTEGDLDAPPERVFAVLADIDSWSKWFDDLRSARWTGASQPGVGATREVALGAITVNETFLAWDVGQRFAFRIDTATLPLIRALVEDWRIEPLPAGRSHLVWRAAYDPTWLTRLLHPLVRAIFSRQFRRSVAGLQRYIKEQPASEDVTLS